MYKGRLLSTTAFRLSADRHNATPLEHDSSNNLTGSDKLFADAQLSEAEEEAALSRQDRASSSSSGLTGADKLLADALALEAEEERILDLRRRAPDPTEVPWTGEERIQDTVLRMVMDKYKPLRLDPTSADEKIKAGIQQPSSPDEVPDSLEAFGIISTGGEGVEGEHEGGRKLPKTPDAKPWRAVYVRPAHLLGAGAEESPSIHYGQFLKASSSLKGGSSEVRAKLKAAGINLSALPTDDPKAMSQLRAGLKQAERRGKLLRARDSVLDYTLARHSSLPHSPSEEQELKGDEKSDTSRNLQLQLGHAQGWDSVVEKRIKAALDSGAFKENKFRGKPLKRDIEEKNPFLAREEYFMNRIVKRQGAAPPWVELNMELEAELASWRGRVEDAWIRRASRMITTSSHLSAGLEPLPKGRRGLEDMARRYRDPEWVEREGSYHGIEVKRLNELVRRHNHLAPFTARKGLLRVDLELGAMYARAEEKLVNELDTLLRQKLGMGPEGSRKSGWDEKLGQGGPVSYDMWGREVRPSDKQGREGERGYLDGWWGNSVGGKGEGRAGEGGSGRGGEGGKEGDVQALGIVAAIQKSLAWARQRIGA